MTAGAAPQRLSVAVQAALDPRASGGVQTNLLALVHAMADHRDAVGLDLLVPEHIREAWRAVADPAFGVHAWPFPLHWYRETSTVSPMARLRRLLARLCAPGQAAHDRMLRGLGCQVVHFPYQLAFDTALPSLYEPWDLQHVHLPDLFSPGERAWRTAHYGRACRRATFVVTATAATKRDVMAAFGVPPQRIAVVHRDAGEMPPPPPPERRAALLAALGVAPPFAFFPAIPYPHKNHLRLLEALGVARDRDGLRIPLVLSGRPHAAGGAALEAALDRLGLRGQVSLVGSVPIETLATLYAEARLLAFPSRFEGLGLPLLEAMQYGLPIAASRASCIPEVVGDSALLFDPEDPLAIADALVRLWRDDALRETLAERGRRRRGRFGWHAAAPRYHALYRAAAGQPLDASDRPLLEETLSER